MKMPEPQRQHDWLQQLVGSWTYEGDCDMGPGQPSVKSGGRELVRSLGGLWIIAEGESEMPGGGVGLMRMTLGFDPAKGRFAGSWVGSMMTNQWVYDGSLDAEEKILTLDTVGPSFTDDGGTSSYQDIITIVDADTRTLASRVLQNDKTWNQFLIARYRRTG